MHKDENGNEDARVIGNFDNAVRKGVMTDCYKSLRQNRIGPKTQKLMNNNFLNSPLKMEQVIKDVATLRKATNPNFLS